MAAVAGASYVYHQYAHQQQGGRWGQFMLNNAQQPTSAQGPDGQRLGEGQGRGNETLSNALVPAGTGGFGNHSSTASELAAGGVYRREAEQMKQSLRDMQERIEMQSAQLQEAVKL